MQPLLVRHEGHDPVIPYGRYWATVSLTRHLVAVRSASVLLLSPRNEIGVAAAL